MWRGGFKYNVLDVLLVEDEPIARRNIPISSSALVVNVQIKPKQVKLPIDTHFWRVDFDGVISGVQATRKDDGVNVLEHQGRNPQEAARLGYRLWLRSSPIGAEALGAVHMEKPLSLTE